MMNFSNFQQNTMSLNLCVTLLISISLFFLVIDLLIKEKINLFLNNWLKVWCYENPCIYDKHYFYWVTMYIVTTFDICNMCMCLRNISKLSRF